MVDTLAPRLSSGVAFEQPVAEPSTLSGIAGLASSLISTIPQPRGPSEADRKNQALQPLAQRLAELQTAEGNTTQLRGAARKATTEFISQFPEYTDEATKLMEVTGFDVAPIETTAEDALTTGLNEWLTTPEGQMAAISSRTLRDDGTLDDVATTENLRISFVESVQEQELLAKTKRNLDQAQSDLSLWKSKSETALNEFIPRWTQESQRFVDGIVLSVLEDPTAVGGAEGAIQQLNLMKNSLSDSFRQRSFAAGIMPDVYTKERQDQLVAPINNLLNTIQANRDNEAALLKSLETAAELQLSDQFTGVVGSIGAAPSFKRAVTDFVANSPAILEPVTKVIQFSKEQDELGNSGDPVAITPNLPDNSTASYQTGSVADPAKVDLYREMSDGDIVDRVESSASLLSHQIAGATGTTEGKTEVQRNIASIVALSESRPNQMGINLLRKVFSDSSVRALGEVAKTKDQFGVDTTSLVASFAGQQTRRNISVVSSAVRGASERALFVKNEDGVLSLGVDRARLEEVMSSITPGAREQFLGVGNTISSLSDQELLRKLTGGFFQSSVEEAQKALESINLITRSVKRIDEQVFKDQIEALSAFFPGTVVGGAGSTELGGGAGDDSLVALIDRTEGGGDYNTLFGFSNREGRRFESIKVSEMTLGELSEFSQGDYAKWSRGQLGRTATPMGKYQIVGATMRQVQKEMGLPNNIIFNEEVQDAMFHHLATKALSGKTSAADKRKALRGVWEGFKGVSDEELDVAIAQFEGTPAPSLADIQSRDSNVQTAPSVSPRPEEAPLDLVDPESLRGTESQSVVQAPQASVEGGNGVTAGVPTGEPSEAARQASEQVWSSLANQTQNFLIRLFGTEDAARGAIASGEVSMEDVRAIFGEG